MRKRVDNYLKLTVRGQPEPAENGEPRRIGRLRVNEIAPIDSHSPDFDRHAREMLDLFFTEAELANEGGFTASVSAFDAIPFARFLRPGEILPEIGELAATSWGAS